jgi:hypothetical protein
MSQFGYESSAEINFSELFGFVISSINYLIKIFVFKLDKFIFTFFLKFLFSHFYFIYNLKVFLIILLLLLLLLLF